MMSCYNAQDNTTTHVTDEPRGGAARASASDGSIAPNDASAESDASADWAQWAGKDNVPHEWSALGDAYDEGPTGTRRHPSDGLPEAESKAQRRVKRLLALDNMTNVVATTIRQVVQAWSPSQLFQGGTSVHSPSGSVWLSADISFEPWSHASGTPDVGATPLWDRTVHAHHSERRCMESDFSPYMPVFHEEARRFAAGSVLASSAGAIQELTAGHPHGHFVVNGARCGFSLLSDLAPCVNSCEDREFSPEATVQIDAWIDKQLSTGKLVDVTDRVRTGAKGQMEAVFISPFATAPKSGGAEGEIRVCHDMSFAPHGSASMNASIDFEGLSPIDLVPIDVVLRRWRFLRTAFPDQQIYGARVDMSAFFRQIPIRYRDVWRTAQRWRGKTLVHTVLSFGGRSAPHTSSVLSNVVSDLMSRLGHWAPCFLDDFIMLGTREMVEAAISALRGLLQRFGLVENCEKFIAPTTSLVILGVAFDFVANRAWISTERRDVLLAEIAGVLKSRKVTVVLVQRLAGRLAFVSSVVVFGRGYTAPLWALLAGRDELAPHHRVAVTAEARAALQWWISVLRGERLVVDTMEVGLSPDRPLHVVVGLQTDASEAGWGGLSLSHRLYVVGTWTEDERTEWSINPRECAVPLFLLGAMAMQGLLSGCVVIVEIDNTCSVAAISRQSSKSHVLRYLVRMLAALQELGRFFVIPRHLAGRRNGWADGLSRGKHPSLCLPAWAEGWSELTIPPSLRELGCLAQCPGQRVPSRDPSHNIPPSTTSWDCALDDVKEPLAAVTVPIPWIPFLSAYRSVEDGTSRR